ncbi:hypothetical protein Tco_0829800, partial [Tanacetum coccineum]
SAVASSWVARGVMKVGLRWRLKWVAFVVGGEEYGLRWWRGIGVEMTCDGADG